ncbi:MAG TPA: hypothetical protein VHM70_10210 [Polyangiaceae bacterium]|jgi:hypothetical protein|nr:hypothetical protein [Polyangiaceae bacterium]
MKHLTPFCIACLLSACGPSYDAERVMTPEERIQEQERLAYEEEQKHPKGSEPQVELTDPDAEVKSFDVQQAELEIRRATLSAVTCPDTAPKAPKGAGEVTINFRSDGKVKEASLNSPFAGSPVEECVLTAYRAVIVPTFKEPEYTMTWKVDLSGKKQDLMPKKEDEVAAALTKDKRAEECAGYQKQADENKAKKAKKDKELDAKLKECAKEAKDKEKAEAKDKKSN